MPTADLPVIRDRPVGGQQRTSHWNSPKRQRTISCTDQAWHLLDLLSTGNDGMNRSEIIEVLVRKAVLDDVELGQERTRILVHGLAATELSQ